MDARQSDAVAPQLIFRTVGIRICEPFPYLLIRFRLFSMRHDLAVRLKNIAPESYLIISRILFAEVSAPPVGKSLQPCTLGRCQPADDVIRFILIVDESSVVFFGLNLSTNLLYSSLPASCSNFSCFKSISHLCVPLPSSPQKRNEKAAAGTASGVWGKRNREDLSRSCRKYGGDR